MSDFYNASEVRQARKAHRCTYCGQEITDGEKYTFQKGNHDGRWFESKMHPECFDDLCENGDGEYTLFGGERPATVGASAYEASAKR